MTLAFLFGTAAGVGVGNLLIYKFLWGWTWLSALGIGATAATICLVLGGLYLRFFT